MSITQAAVSYSFLDQMIIKYATNSEEEGTEEEDIFDRSKVWD